jgi:hypothetical protein
MTQRLSSVDEEVNYCCLVILLILLILSTIALSLVAVLRSYLVSLGLRTRDPLTVVSTVWSNSLDTDVHLNTSATLSFDDIVLIIKTGVEVAADRLHDKLVDGQSFAMFPNLMVVADDSFKIGSIDVFDAIGHFYEQASRTLTEQPNRFREFLARSPPLDVPTTMTPMMTMQSQNASRARDLPIEHSSAGWANDQHKFFTALREAFRRYPQAKWFFLIDDDTYVSAHNLMRVLAPLDHSSVFYGGGTMFFNGCGVRLIGSGPRFCHGGSGILLSNSALVQLVEVADACIVKYSSCWAGDVALALCLHDLSILPTSLLSFHANDPAITAADPKLRCELPATFHHVSAALHEQLFAFERTLNHSMTVSDVARAFLLEPLLRNATWQLGAHERAVVGANLPADDLQVIPLRRVLPLASIVERVVGDELWIEACASYCRQTQSCTGFVLERRGEMRCALKSRLIGRILFENVSESNRSSSTVVGVLEHRFACAAQR